MSTKKNERKLLMANKKIKLKNSTGDYLLPYTTNVPDATSTSKGIVEIEDTPTSGSQKTLTSGGAKTALDAKLDVTGTAAKATADAEGNTISTTYATKTELSTTTALASEAKSIAQGRARATACSNYNEVLALLKLAEKTSYNTGDIFYVLALEVPDLWICGIEEETSDYEYISDQDIVNSIKSNGFIKVGYFKLSLLESDKIDLTNYVPNTRTINGKALSTDVTLSASDIDGLNTAYLTIDGTAQKAVADSEGNNISTTYAKLSDILSYEEMA